MSEKVDKTVIQRAKSGIENFVRRNNKITSQQIIDKLLDGGKLNFITDLKNPSIYVLLAVLVSYFRSIGYEEVAVFYEDFARESKELSVSRNAKRVDVVKEILISVMVEEIRQNQDKVQSIFQKRGN